MTSTATSTVRSLTLDDARRLTDAAYDFARSQNWLIGIAIVDAGGNLLMASRMDGAKFLSPDIARGKAFMSAAKRKASAESEAEQNRRPAVTPGFVAASGGRMVISGGGLPIWDGKRCLGGAGVSGRSSEEDEEILRVAVEAIGLSIQTAA